MSISIQVNEDIKAAMRAKDKVKLEALRAAKTAFTLAKTERGRNEELSGEAELKIIQKLVKQRKESAVIYKNQQRADLYEKEIAEADILGQYLPAKISTEELRKYLSDLIIQQGASGMKDMGRIMGLATKGLTGKADGKEISNIVKELLEG